MLDFTSIVEVISKVVKIKILIFLNKVQPDEIYNLACQSHVHVSFNVSINTSDTIAFGLLRILDAVRICKLENKTKIYQVTKIFLYNKKRHHQVKCMVKIHQI